jgi:hypothetical protein
VEEKPATNLEKMLSKEEEDRLVKFFSLLIEIDKREKVMNYEKQNK